MERTLKYSVVKNPFRDDGTFIPKVLSQMVISFEEVLKDMENNTAIRKQDLRLAITQFHNTIIDHLARGNKVKTPLCSFRPTIRGLFETAEDNFIPNVSTTNHRVEVVVNAKGSLIDEVARNIRIEKITETSVKIPTIMSIKRVTKAPDDNYYAKDVIIVHGSCLKFDEEIEDEGVFWINEAGEAHRSDSYSVNTKSNIHCQVPELVPGEYRMEIASRGGNHKLQTVSSERAVTVA